MTDPIEREFCENCVGYAGKLIEYVRQLENAQIVAKDALESIETLNTKLTMEKEQLLKERNYWREKAKGKEQKLIDDRRKDLDNRYQRFVNRGKLGVE